MRAYWPCVVAALWGWAVSVAAQTVPPPPTVDPTDNATTAMPPADEGAPEPEITIRQRGQSKIEEYRIHGRLYMIKITPSVGRPYYLIDPKGDGSFVRRDGIDKGLIVPSWVLLTW